MRPASGEYFLRMAALVSSRSTCARRKVGCVLVNKRKHVLATGYNGVASGMPHCSEGVECSGANAPSGEKLDECLAIHAEQNAMLQCQDVHEIDIAYITVSPCMHCTKLLLNTSCREIVYAEDYPGGDFAKTLWLSAGRILKKGA